MVSKFDGDVSFGPSNLDIFAVFGVIQGIKVLKVVFSFFQLCFVSVQDFYIEGYGLPLPFQVSYGLAFFVSEYEFIIRVIFLSKIVNRNNTLFGLDSN